MDLDTTASNFRDELVFNLKNRADAGLTDERLDRWINAAYRHMCLPTVHDFREMHTSVDITLVNGTHIYDIDEATVGEKIVAVRSVFNIIDIPETATGRKRVLRPRAVQWFDRRVLVTGSAQVFTIDGESIAISNVPGATEAGQLVRIRFWAEPTRLTTGVTTVLADYYDEVLVLGSQWIAERALGYRDRAEITKQDYIGLLNEGPEEGQLEGHMWDHQVDVNPNAQGEIAP
jgi:hypothetical protein